MGHGNVLNGAAGALCSATTALRASGHRTATQAGHHLKTIESLELTIEANPKLIQRFKTFNNKRNKSDLRRRPGPISRCHRRDRESEIHF
jgi:hypothetical protein